MILRGLSRINAQGNGTLFLLSEIERTVGETDTNLG